jgi:hypothetical protein
VSLAETPEWNGGQAASAPVLSRVRQFAGQNWWTRFGEPVAALADAGPEKGVDAEVGGHVPLYGDGYIYGPAACDCPPPCIDHLWTGYQQYPKRCHMHAGLFRRHCNGGCDGACGACGKGCGAGLSCSTKAACGCAEPVSCTKAADCGCKPVCGSCRQFHLGQRWKGLVAHWHRSCDSCSAPIGCGCATPVDKAIPSEKQATVRPLPLPEDAALLELPLIN